MNEVGTAVGRRLIVVDAPLESIPKVDTRRLGAGFTAMFLLDDQVWKDDQLKRAVSFLLPQGANSFVFYGSRADQAEWIADQVIIKYLGDHETSNNAVTTISRTDQSLSEFLGEATLSFAPAEDYMDGWSSSVFFCIAGSAQADMVAELLR